MDIHHCHLVEQPVNLRDPFLKSLDISETYVRTLGFGEDMKFTLSDMQMHVSGGGNQRLREAIRQSPLEQTLGAG